MSNTEKLSKKTNPIQGKENFFTKIINFFNKFQNWIYGIFIGILVIAAAIILLDRFYFDPQKEKASQAILYPIDNYTQATQSGDTTLYDKALNGDEEYDGFLTIISNYKFTSTANTAKYFAGLCYYHLGDKEEALNFFKSFKHKEDVYWYACQMIIGDIYDDLGDNSKTKKYYIKASKSSDPYYAPIAMFKLGQIYERDNNIEDANKTYKEIKTKFPEQYANMGVEKFLEKTSK